MIETETGLYPQHMFHRRFAAHGRSASPIRSLRAEEQAPMVMIVPGEMASSGMISMPQEMSWWKANDASLDNPMVTFRPDPFTSVVEVRWSDFPEATRKPAGSQSKEGQIEEFLEEVYRLGDLGELQLATDRVFRHLDDLLLEGQYHICDEILARADVKRLPTALMRSFLTITAAAKAKLPARPFFHRDVFKEMARAKGDIDRAHRLLDRLA